MTQQFPKDANGNSNYLAYVFLVGPKRACHDTSIICPKRPMPIGYTVFLHCSAIKSTYQHISKTTPKTHTTIKYIVFLRVLKTKPAYYHTPKICPKRFTPIGYTVFLHGLATKICFA